MDNKINKNKIVELPCFVGDTVFYIQYQTSANLNADRTPVIVEMTVEKVTYEARRNIEKIRIDTTYINKFGDRSFDWFNWDDGYLYVTRQEAENKIARYIELN